MIPLAKSLNPRPDHAYEAQEAAALRAANAPPPAHVRVPSFLEGCVIDHGFESTHKAAARWVRENRPQRIRKPANDATAQSEALKDRVFGKPSHE